MWDIIVNSSDIPPDSLQRNVFVWNAGDPCPQPVQLNVTHLESCKYLKGFDYFAVRRLFSSLTLSFTAHSQFRIYVVSCDRSNLMTAVHWGASCTK